MKKISEWFTANELTLHPAKTNFMIYNTPNKEYFNNKIKINDTVLERIGETENEKSTKFVGIYIDENLTWKHHISHIITKINKNIFLINLLKNHAPIKTRIMAYNALIKSHLEYGCIIWGQNASKIKTLIKKQKHSIRILAKSKNRISHTNKIFA